MADSRSFLLLGLGALLALLVIGALLLSSYLNQPSSAPTEQEKIRLTYATAGDVNMLALMQNVIAPMYENRTPNVMINTIQGPGEAGSRLIFEKLKAAKDAKKACWDIDVAVVH